MKFLGVVALAVATSTSVVDAQSAASCLDQSRCIDFTYNRLCYDPCSHEEGAEDDVGDHNCIIEVCMHVNTGKDSCVKLGEGIKLVCDASDNHGCPYNGHWSTPTFDPEESDYGVCPDYLGQAYTDAGALTRCKEVSVMTMCQNVFPGDMAYFILEDGDDCGPDDGIEYFEDDMDDRLIKCSNGDSADAFSCSDGVDDDKNWCQRTWMVQAPVDLCQSTSCEETTTLPPASSQGDPHFRTFKGEHFEYHGQCDMVLAQDPEFGQGLGLDIHIRTKLVRFWSYVKNAAIRIGDEILEVEGFSGDTKDLHYWYNLQYQKEITRLGGFPVHINQKSPIKRIFTIDLARMYPGAKIEISTYREFVRVNLIGITEDAFGKSVGMFGNYQTGKTLSRDGVTELNDFSQYGQEWQVLPSENMLFHNTEEPQFPAKCIEPEDPRGERRRRLDESSVTEEAAEKACAGIKNADDRKDCIYDILATQDLGMVGAY